MEQEQRKKYTGPVGKDPWKDIAEDWTGTKKTGKLDFADELAMLRNQMKGGVQGYVNSFTIFNGS